MLSLQVRCAPIVALLRCIWPGRRHSTPGSPMEWLHSTSRVSSAIQSSCFGPDLHAFAVTFAISELRLAVPPSAPVQGRWWARMQLSIILSVPGSPHALPPWLACSQPSQVLAFISGLSASPTRLLSCQTTARRTTSGRTRPPAAAAPRAGTRCRCRDAPRAH